jgi:hypothetical protein
MGKTDKQDPTLLDPAWINNSFGFVIACDRR